MLSDLSVPAASLVGGVVDGGFSPSPLANPGAERRLAAKCPYLRETHRWHLRCVMTASRAGGHLETPDTEALMRTYRIGDPWTEGHLLRAEELHVEARAFSARRALLRTAR